MNMSVRSEKHLLARVFAAVVAVTLAVLSLPAVALAEEYPDVFLASFMDRWDWCSDNIYVSYDGKTFELLSTPFKAIDSQGKIDSGTSWGVYSLHDPGIAYKDGVFWMLSGYVDNGTFKANFASSKDLVNWTYPASPEGFDGSVDVWPPVPEEKYASNRIARGNYDAAAPDFLIDDNGDCWVVACLGYFGIFHGEDGVDFVQPYICKVTGLARNYYNDHYAPWWEGPGDYDLQAAPQGTSTQMKRINLPFNSNNWIDSSLYKENGKYYLSIKRDGVTNMVFSIDDLNRASDKNAWTLVNNNVCTGYEGPCLTKGKDLQDSKKDKYFFYTDGLEKEGNPTGIYWQTCESIGGKWSNPQRIVAKDVLGNPIPTRHGSVMRVTDPEAKQVIFNLRNSLGYTRFTDVVAAGSSTPPNTPHAEHILWLADTGITTGYSDHTYRGSVPVYRQDMAAFLYRLAGSPDYEVTEEDLAKFSDVTTNTPHYREICWLANAGISKGWDMHDGTFEFRGGNTVKRQDMAAFLHRLAIWKRGDNTPEGSKENIFSDVTAPDAEGKGGTPHYEHILWLASTGVTTGWTVGNTKEYRGMNDVVRQDMAAFLHRMYDNVLYAPLDPTAESDDVAVDEPEVEPQAEEAVAEEPAVVSDDSTIDQ